MVKLQIPRESIKFHFTRRKKCNTFYHKHKSGGGNKSLKTSHASHKLPKIALGLALLFGGANVAFAEESGGFVGFGIGGGGTQFKSSGGGETYKENRSGLNYGFVGGYKQFFTPYLGLRYYVNVDLHHNMSKDKEADPDTGKKETQEMIIANYGVNVDFLGNFIAEDGIDFGGFIGLGLGANTLAGKWVKDAKDSFKASGVKFTDTGFDIALNVGLRTNIATNHGLEVVARVPFLPVTVVNEGGFKYTFGQTYSVLARYTFSF